MDSARSIVLNSPRTSNVRLGSTSGPAVAVCGIGMKLLNGNLRGMGGLWSLLLPKDAEQQDTTQKYAEMVKESGDAEEVANTNGGSHATLASMVSSPTSDLGESEDTMAQKLIEVAYQALEDGAEVDYRGAKACVGLYIGTAASELDMNGTADEDSALSKIQLTVSRYHDLQGPQ
jgi:hypothetical protein